MPYRDIQAPYIGDKQLYKTNGQSHFTDIVTYLGYLNDNLAQGFSGSPVTLVNGVAGEKITIPVQTSANTLQLTGIGFLLQPIVFPTAGTIQKTITTPYSPSMIHVLLQTQAVCITAQVGVHPAIGLKVEYFYAPGNYWVQLEEYEPHVWNVAGGTLMSHAAGEVMPLAFYTPIPTVFPNTQYRITALGGTWSIAALPNTGQWSIDATGNNTLEFAVWVGG